MTASRIRLVLLLCCSTAAAAQTAGQPAPAAAAATWPSAPAAGGITGQPQPATELADVVIDGQVIMRVRGSSTYPARRRAAEIEDNILAVARDETIPADAVTIREDGTRTLLMAGDRLLIDLYDPDARIEGLSRELLAQDRRAALQEAIAAYRLDREWETLATESAYAAAAIAVSALLILVLWRGFRRLSSALDRRLKTQLKELEAKSARLIRSRRLTGLLRALTKIAFLALVALTLYLGLNYVLALYPWTRGAAIWLFSLILTPLKEIGRGLLATIPDLVWLLILYLIARYILGMFRAFFQGIDQGDIKLASFDRELAWPTYRIVRLVVIVFALVMAYPHIPGSQSPAFQALSVLAGLIISLGSQSIIGNVIAGYSLIYRRPFKIGDRIRLDDIVGEVREIRVLSTRLRSLKNEEVVIPNTSIINGEIINYSSLAREQGLILHTRVGIGYETPWRQVEAMLKEAAGRTGGLLSRPKPFVLQQALGDFAVTYEINAYCADANNMMQIYSALHRNILDVFNEYGVAIMTPSYIADPPEPKLVPQEQWYAPPAMPPGDIKPR